MGIVGYKGPPTIDGTVEVGYSVMEAHRRRGYASEAVAALVERAFDFLQVVRVVADTFPDLTASILVLERNGFAAKGEGSDEGSIRYEVARSHRAAGQEFGPVTLNEAAVLERKGADLGPLPVPLPSRVQRVVT